MAKSKKVKASKKISKFGIAKFLVVALVLGGGLIYGTQMVQKNQENRSSAAGVTVTYTGDEYSEGTKKVCSDIGGKCGSFAFKLKDGVSCKVGSVTGIIYSSKCGGGSKVKCCAPSKSPTPTPTPVAKKVYTVYEYSKGTNKACSNIGGKCGEFASVLSGGTDCKVGSVTGIIYSGKCDGGSKVKCCAPKGASTTSAPATNKTRVDGKCGSSKNMCDKGSSRDTADTVTYYQWKCDGQYGGSTATCSCSKKKCK